MLNGPWPGRGLAAAMLCLSLAVVGLTTAPHGGGEAETPESSQTPVMLPDGGYATGTPSRQAQQILAQLAPIFSSHDFDSAVKLRDARQYALEAVKLVPESARAHRVLGHALMEETRYEQAEAAFSRAVELDPKDQESRAGLREANRLARLVDSLPLDLSNGRSLFRLAEVPRSGRPGVFALVGYPAEDASDCAVRAHYFMWDGSRYRESYRTPNIGYKHDEGPNEMGFARLCVGDLQRNGRPQVLLIRGWVGADWIPMAVDIFQPRRAGMKQILHLGSSAGAERVDLDRDGRPEVQVTNYVGATLTHAEMGGWTDVYRYDGRRYVRANARFREFSRGQLNSMLSTAEDHPDDWDTLKRVAQAYRDLGQPGKAAPYETKARRLQVRAMQ